MKRLAIILLSAFILFAATQATAVAMPVRETILAAATPLPGRSAYGPAYFPKEVNPLSGLPVAAPSLLERRPIAIKVTNFPRSVRPQWGLSAADHVYEYYIGDEMSRFIGIFYGMEANRVGPVRSARLFDEHILRMYRSVLVFGWADDPVLEFLTQADIRPFLIVERANNCPPLCRIGPKYAYNTLFADTPQIAPYLEGRRTDNARQKLTGLRFEAETPKSGHLATEVSIRYSAVSYHRWEYNTSQGRYLRFQETQDDYGRGTAYAPMTDSLTNSQISAANVLILLVPHEYYIRYSNTDIIDQALEGGGAGYALRDGQIYPITWEHETPDQLLKLTLPDERAYPLKPGNTWFEVLSDLSQLHENGKASWHFDFVLPE
ncbi:MAG: hypothetical protein A2W36_05175 [Chloroflexi bacterium RBG_16_58_14]|nr:MAG: hypothetical protein A2W36_05175 [Chloroflexi bacterium RBG_16_58_14]